MDKMINIVYEMTQLKEGYGIMSKTHSFFRYLPVSNLDLQWGFHVTAAGEARITPDTPYPPGGHPKDYDFSWKHGRVLHNLAVVYISSGRGWFESKYTPRQRIESGQAFMLFPGIWHSYVPDKKTGWTEHWVCFDGETPNRLIKQDFFSPKKPIFKVNREDRLLDIFSDIIEAIKNDQPALQQVISAATGYILARLYSARQANIAGPNKVATAIHETIRRMNSTLDAEIDLKRLARELNVGYTWFRRSFLQHTGLSPYQYLLQLRIARARALLTNTTLTIKETAHRTGFENEHYFSRQFRKKTGLTPSQWCTDSRKME